MKLSPEDQAVYKVRLRVAGAILRRAKTVDELTHACDRLDALEKEFAKRQILPFEQWLRLIDIEIIQEQIAFDHPHWVNNSGFEAQMNLLHLRDMVMKQYPEYECNFIFRWERPAPVVVPVKTNIITRAWKWLTWT